MAITFCNKCSNRLDQPPALMYVKVQCPNCRGFGRSKPACQSCQGSGQGGYILANQPCHPCGGTGLQNDYQELLECWRCHGARVVESDDPTRCDNPGHQYYSTLHHA